MEDEALLTIIFAFFALFVVMFLVGIIMFIFQAIGLFRIAKREGQQDKAWMACIPVVNTFLMMLLLEKAVHDGLRDKLTLIYGISLAVSVVLGSFVPFISFLPLAFFYYAFYFLAKRYSPNPILHLVIGIVTLGFSVGIQLFILRNREVVDATGLEVAATADGDDIIL